MADDTGDQSIRILHLSDLHFRAGRAWDADPVLRALAGFIKGEIDAGLVPDLVAITGDLAFAGSATEYALARKWLDDLWPKLGGLKRDRLLIVPGNHDVDRSAVDFVAEATQDKLLAKRNQDTIAEVLGKKEQRDVLLRRHAAYLAFLSDWLGETQTLPWWERVIEIGGCRLHVAGLDSAWMACGDADRGRLLLGHYQLTQTIETAAADGAHWRIALLHHPWDYLAEFEHQQACDLVHQR